MSWLMLVMLICERVKTMFRIMGHACGIKWSEHTIIYYSCNSNCKGGNSCINSTYINSTQDSRIINSFGNDSRARTIIVSAFLIATDRVQIEFI